MAEKEGMFAKSKAARFVTTPDTQLVSKRTYNMVLGLSVLWGLFINAVLVVAVPSNVIYGLVSGNVLLFFIAYLVLCFAGIFISYKSDKPAISFLGYNMVVVPLGLLVAFMVDVYIGAGASTAVWQALVMTTLITAFMVVAAMAFPNFFSKIGGVLFIALIGVVIVDVICLLFGFSQVFTTYIAAAIFALYIGYDYWKSQQYLPTVDNAIDSAVDLYMDIAMLFIQLLEIYGNNK